MTVRIATHQDIPGIIAIGRVMRDTTNFSAMDYDDEVFADTLSTMIKKGQFVLVSEKDGEIVGAMLGMMAQSWFGKDWLATDMGLFMHPNHRGSFDAIRMIKTFVTWAKECGCRQVRPGVSTGFSGAERLYEALGFDRAGSLFVLNVGE